jgi:hypothetical protein
MAITQTMIQLDVVQELDHLVSTVYALDDEVVIILQPNMGTVVRELTVEAMGGVLASQSVGLSAVTMTGPFVQLTLLLAKRGLEQTFFGPSHVASPSIDQAIGAVLRVTDTGISVESPGQLSIGRRVAAHAYIDQL